METEHLKEYVVLCKSLSFAKAADELFISQPTLRYHIKTLEEELGSSLFMKRNNQLELTPAGKFFLVKSQQITGLVEASVTECRSAYKDYRSITVGTLGCSWFEEALHKARTRFEHKHPGKHLEILFASGMTANRETLLRGEADLILFPHVRHFSVAEPPATPQLPAGLLGEYLKSERHLFWITDENPLFGRVSLTTADLAPLTLLVGNTDNMVATGNEIAKYFTSEGIDLTVKNWPFKNYTEYFFSGDACTFGLYLSGMVPHLESRQDYQLFTIADIDIQNDVYVVYNESHMVESDVEFLAELKAIFAE